MNRNRRKELKYALNEMEEIIDSIQHHTYGDVVDLMDLIEDSKYNIEYLMDEEQDALENMPENFQCSSRGEEMEENIMALDQASNTLCDLSNEVDPTIIVTTLQEVITTLEDLV